MNASNPRSYFHLDDASGSTALLNSAGTGDAALDTQTPSDAELEIAGAVAGVTGTALSLAGTGSVDIPSTATASGARSYELFLRLEPNVTEQDLFYRSGFSDLTIRIDDQRRVRVEGDSGPGGGAVSSPLAAGVWHHVAITIGLAMAGGFTTIFINGESDGTGMIFFFGLDDGATLGSLGDSVALSIDELAIYNGQLSGSEVAAHYAAAGLGD